MKIIPLIMVLCMTLLPAPGCGRPEKKVTPSGKIIRIGVIGPLSGPFSNQGKRGFEGLKAARKIQPLLRNGDALEFVAEDDQEGPSRTIAALRKLIEIDKVAAVLIFSDSASVLKLKAFADRFRTPIIAIIATHPDINKNNNYITQLCYDDVFQGSVAALFVRDELLFEKVAIVDNSENPFSVRLAAEFRQKFESTGGQVTEVVSLTDEVDDLSAIMEILRLKKTQLLYMPVKAKRFINLVKATQNIKWYPKIMGSDGLLSTVLAEYPDDREFMEGLLGTDFFGNQIIQTKYAKRLEKMYASLFHHPVGRFSALGSEAYTILCDAMNRCRVPGNRQEINEKLRQTTDFIGMSGKMTITKEGKTIRPLFVKAIEDGKLKVIVKVY